MRHPPGYLDAISTEPLHPAAREALIAALEQRCSGVEAFELFTGDRSVENLRLYDRHGYRHARTTVLSPAVSLVFLRKPAPAWQEPP